MPFLLLRHCPIVDRKSEAWMVQVDNILPPSAMMEALTTQQLHGHPRPTVKLETLITTSERKAQEVVRQAQTERDLWNPCYLVVAFLRNTYQFKAPNGAITEGGESLLNRMSKKNLSHSVEHIRSSAVVKVVEVALDDLYEAVDVYAGEQNGVIMQLFSDENAKVAEERAMQWREDLERELVAKLRQKHDWEPLVASLRIHDRDDFDAEKVVPVLAPTNYAEEVVSSL